MSTRRKTILINLLSVRAGGQVTRAKAFLKRIRRFDPDSRVIVLQGETAGNFLDSSNADIQVVPISFIFSGIPALQRILWENIILSRLIKRLHVDVFITFSHYLPRKFPSHVFSIVGVSNLAPFSRAAAMSEHLSIRVKMFLQKRSILASARRASEVLALSVACRNILVGNGIDAGKISVIPNGVEARNIDNLPFLEVLGRYSIGTRYVLYVSHFHRYKNHIRLIDAYSLLPLEVRSGLQLVMVGKPFNTEYFQEVLSRIDEKGVADDVVVIPGLKTDELSVVYSSATLFMFPSLIENCPNILLEAMAYGLPILSSWLEPMPEFCKHAAVLFDPLSVDDMCRKLRDCLGNEECLRLLADRATERSQDFSWDDFTGDVTSLYLERH